MTTLELPEAGKKIIDHYLQLNIAGKHVITPYYMNLKQQSAGLRVMVGKGSPDEIEREVKVLAQLRGFDLQKADENKIRKFLIDRDLGVDCSGFVTHVLNAILEDAGKGKLIKYLVFKDNSILGRLRRLFRPVENIGANLMTNEDNTEIVGDLSELKPGDFIRSKGKQKNSHHILLITKVILEGAKIKEFEYAQSSADYEGNHGVRIEKVIVTNPALGLKDQQWQKYNDNENWSFKNLLKDYEDNGIRRLKRVEIPYITI